MLNSSDKINMRPHTYHERFFRELENLNEAQRAAVDQIEGPVLVIAGPGTGKTHVLAARIGKILLETDAQAANILCLTFTDAGVRAMRKRLLEWIGPEAHRVHIYTFHSFCNSVIQENLELFGRQDLEPVSDLERIEIVRDLLGELAPEHPLKRQLYNPYHYEQHLADLFDRIKGENWTPEYVLRQIDLYVESLPEREEFRYKVNHKGNKKGELKRTDYLEALDRMDLLRAAVRLFPRFQERMRERRRYDYDDMILWVLDAFEKYPFLLRNYQERYHYFLVDEYQDTNGAQHAVLQRLIGYWESPNIFIVGDDDQSIYEFQGARLKNLVDFYEAYPEVAVISLEENYRSAQGLLDAAHGLIERNEKRIVNALGGLGLEKRLLAAHPDVMNLPVEPVLASYPNPVHEIADLLARVEALSEQGVALEEIAFIYPQHRQGEWLRNLLGKRGIPFQIKRKVNILDLPLIRQIRRALSYLQAEQKQPYSGDALLFPLLHDGYWGISPEMLAALSKNQKPDDETGRVPWRDLIRDPQAPGPIHNCARLMDEILRLLPGWPVPRILEALFTRAGILAYILEHPEREELLQAAYTFMAFAREESIRHPRLALDDFLHTLAKMDANGLSIDLRQPAIVEKGVNLLTAHSAKGLEFDYVFLLDTTAAYWEPKNSRGRYQFTFPDTLTFSGEEDALEARRRLFYVSMTRARKGLCISYSEEDMQGKAQAHAQFVDELIEDGLAPEAGMAPPELARAAQVLWLSENQKPEIAPALSEEEIAARLAGFQLSISALNTLLRCPLSFYYEYVLQAPQLESVSGLYGTAVHRALQAYFNRAKGAAVQAFPPPAELAAQFEREWSALNAFIPPDEFQHRLALGRRYLQGYAEARRPGWTTDARLEMTLKQVEIDGVPVQGKIDRVDYLDAARVRLVDYKTGKPDSKKWRGPTAKEPQGSPYWRQMAFYQLLYQASNPAAPHVQGALLSFVEPDAKGEWEDHEFRFTEKDLALMHKLIAEASERIQRRDFYNGCGEPGCNWCNFAREKTLPGDLSNPQREELDDV
jgi:DNA helicase II / ATP-dependent DNA helicase PcrA